MHRATYRRGTGVTLAVLLAAGAGAALAGDEDPDGVNLRADWPDGGDAELELEARNVEPAVCFIWRAEALRDGDSLHSRILTRGGAFVLDLGVGDQFVEGSASGCEIPLTDAYRQVFAQPGNYVVEVRVVERPGSGAHPVVRSGPLEESSG